MVLLNTVFVAVFFFLLVLVFIFFLFSIQAHCNWPSCCGVPANVLSVCLFFLFVCFFGEANKIK